MAVFKPTGTTDILIKSIKSFITGGRLLDLGCGSGVIGAEFREKCQVYASDLSLEAITRMKMTYPDIDVRQSDLFEAWDMKFDYIVDDVSGVAEEIAKVSPWFKGVPCNSGKDGADLVVKVLEEASKYLNENGKLFFPIVSLSNVNRILDTANRLYKVELLSHTDFPLPQEMYKYIDLLRELKKEGIQFQEKFGMILFFTDIYMAKV